MNIRIAVVGLAALFLSACTEQDWNHALTFVGVNDRPAPRQAAARPAARLAQPSQPVQPASVQQAEAPKVNSFCESVAKQDSEDNDFDQATQQRVFIRSYQQCVTIFGDATK